MAMLYITKGKETLYCNGYWGSLAPKNKEDKEKWYEADMNKVMLSFVEPQEMKMPSMLCLTFTTAGLAWAYWYAYKLSYPEMAKGWYAHVADNGLNR